MRETAIDLGVCSDAGVARPVNEDAAVAFELCTPAGGMKKTAVLAAVADGMGGHAAGEVASRAALDAFAGAAIAMLSKPDGSAGDIVRVTEQAFERANTEVCQRGQAHPERTGMGTTLTTALIRDGRLCLGHVGDSRAYLVRGGRVVQLTRDHSLVREKLASGLITPEEARFSVERNKLTRAVGVRPAVVSDIICEDLYDGDAVLLCTDGLHGSLGAPDLAKVLGSGRNPQAACEYLVRQAKARDGSDNITAVCVRINGRMRGSRPGAQAKSGRTATRLFLWLLLCLVAGLMSAVGARIVRRMLPPSPPKAGAGASGREGSSLRSSRALSAPSSR